MSNHDEAAKEIEQIAGSIKSTVQKARSAIAGLDDLADAIDDIDCAFGWVIDVLDGMNDRMAKLEAAHVGATPNGVQS